MALKAPGTTGFSVHTDDLGRWVYASGTRFPVFDINPPRGAKFYREDLDQWYRWDGDSWEVDATGATLVVAEADGVPSGDASTLQFDSDDGLVVSDLGGGVFQIDLADVPLSTLASQAESTLVGREEGSGAGVPGVITLGSGLSMTGSILSATATPAPDQEARILAYLWS